MASGDTHYRKYKTLQNYRRKVTKQMNRSDGRISIIAVKLECAMGVKGILDVPIPKIILSKMSSFQQNITKHAKK